jgi:hypothetical protein
MLRAACSILALLCAASPALAQEMADRIFTGGPVLTMDDAAPRAEAVAVKDGRIIAVGPEAEIMALQGPATEVTDLAGRALLPGFFDAHGHVFIGGVQALTANILAPPDGNVTDIPSLQQTIRDWVAENEETVKATGIIMGFGWDKSTLAEGRDPTLAELDAISTEYPVLLIHQSSHLGAANSLALARMGINRDTPNPPGGVIVKDANGNPTGILEENAFILTAMTLLKDLDPEAMKTIVEAGAKLWSAYGYTTAVEGRSTPPVIETMRAVGAEGRFDIDVITYPDILITGIDYIADELSPTYTDRVRVAGAKLTIDGSPQGFTALRDRPYFDPVGTYPPGYLGYPAATTEQVTTAIDQAFAAGVPIITHANGEGASDILIAAIDAATSKHGADPDRRPVLIHGQFLREDQMDSYNRLNVMPSLFPMHTFYWGDWHRDHTVGPDLADNISPTGWAVRRGMRFSTHHDAPVAFPDSMRVLDATVTRRSRSGDVIGPAQRVDVMTALKAMTIWPAWQAFEEDSKGSIEVGKLADLVILSQDPTAIDPEIIDTITVAETVKEGATIFLATEDEGRLDYRPRRNGDDPMADFLRYATVQSERGTAPGKGISLPVATDAPHDGACVAGFMMAVLGSGDQVAAN